MCNADPPIDGSAVEQRRGDEPGRADDREQAEPVEDLARELAQHRRIAKVVQDAEADALDDDVARGVEDA